MKEVRLKFEFSELSQRPVLKIKAFLGMLARLSWGRRNMIGSMDGKDGRVCIEYVQGLTNEFAG